MAKKRNSNIELLRIISIVMIVISHYCAHGAINTSNLSIGINRILIESLTIGHLGTIIFVLISGYYLISSNSIKLKKLMRLVFQIFFYSVLIYISLIIFGKQTLNVKDLIKNIFPISFKMYWFATAYIILYIFHPYINKLLNNISQKEHLRLNITMFVIFSVLRSLNMSDYYGNELIQFIFFYSIGAYLFKYPHNFFEKNNNNLKLLFISAIIILFSVICIDILKIYIPKMSINSRYFLSRTSPFAILFSVSLFDIFSRKKDFNNSIINNISSLVFGVYLISDNCYIRPILWKTIFNNEKYSNSPFLILHLIVSVVITIVVCLIIEYLRKQLLEKYVFTKIDKKLDFEI